MRRQPPPPLVSGQRRGGRWQREGWAKIYWAVRLCRALWDALHAVPGGAESGLRREMTFEEWIRIYLVTKVGTTQGERAACQSAARQKDPTPFQFCLPQGWAQGEKCWETISLSPNQNRNCFSIFKTFFYVSAAICRNHTIFATLVLAM